MTNEVKRFSPCSWKNDTSMKNSEWLAENVEGVDRCIKDILQLIKQEDINVQNVDIVNQLHPAIVTHMKEISLRHHMLADQNYELMKELSATLMHHDEGNIFVAQPNSSLVTPDKKFDLHKVGGQLVTFDLSASSNSGISSASLKEGSESSYLSDSEMDDYYSCCQSNSVPSVKMLKNKTMNTQSEEAEMEGLADKSMNEQMCSKEMLSRISEYEEQLNVSCLKLQVAEEEIVTLKKTLLKNEEVIASLCNADVELVSAKNHIKLLEADIELENKNSLTLHEQITELEAKLLVEKRKVLEFQEMETKYAAKLSGRDLEIQKLTTEQQDASGYFALEKWGLESRISDLLDCLTSHEARNEELQKQCKSLTDKVQTHECRIHELERNQEAFAISWNNEIKLKEAEICQKNVVVENLNVELDGMKLQYDTLMSEKNAMNTKLQALSADLSFLDNHIQLLEYDLHELRSQNVQLNAGSESANSLTGKLKSRIHELDAMVEMQKVLISDIAEQKREAIRQLCFSVDHFKSAYKEIYAHLNNKRPSTIC